MKERDLAEQFLRDHVLAARALVALQLNQLPEEIRSRVNQAIANGTGYAALHTRISTGETELVLVPADGSEALSLAEARKWSDNGSSTDFTLGS